MDKAVVFDVGRVLFDWQLRALFAKLIDDRDELDTFLSEVVTEEWHFQTDRGRNVHEMVEERVAQYPQYAELIRAYADRFNETIPGPVPGSLDIVRRLHAAKVPIFGLTNFGHELWEQFRPGESVFDLFEDIVVSGTEKVAKPDPRIYAIVEERSGKSGASLFFTDDNPDNIAAARARGWDAYRFIDASTLEADLARAGLLT
ncbi:HAD family hydrolase [Qipengyuania nanhaisediminis]|uniref:HAD family hydrolase n=1 Tax=Qipengyuania nanhaisediminis TaxID=604088 RepID=UPI0038B32BAE